MHSGAAPPSHPSTKKKVVISKQQADLLHQKAKLFEKLFQEQQATFNHSQYKTYYIVSTKFLQQWRDYATAHSLQRYPPGIMNQDIFENNTLKLDLKQKQDFQFISQKLFKFFEEYKVHQIKRHVVLIGNQRRIPLYLKSYEYLIITHEDLRYIDRNQKKLSQLILDHVELSQEATIQDMLKQISEDKRLLLSTQKRLWKIGKRSIQAVYNHIKKQCQPIHSYDYKIKCPGKKIDELTAKVGDLQIQEGQFLILQKKDSMRKWHFFSDTQGKCQGCYQICQLKFPCGCKKVAYCKQQCQQKDKKFHLKNCDFAQLEELNKKVQMKLTQNSSRGRVGLSNLGNTCFMNSCLQCLSNTLPLTNYFIKGYYQEEINKVNPIGTKGKLAKTYAKFIKAMWCDSNSTFSPYNIKGAVSSIAPMFSGYAQHDSQQFFSFLVDGLHEDLNRIEKKPYVQSIQNNGKADSVVALQSWMAHIKRNQSIIVDLMTGQYKSKVTCPDCHLQSITFDPFITVTLPIPQKVSNIMYFYLIFNNMHTKTQKFYISYQKNKPDQWLTKASMATGLQKKTIGLYVVSSIQGIYKVGRDSMGQMIHKLQAENKNMFCIEYSKEQLQMKNPIQIPVRFAKKSSYEYENLWFKFPFIFEKQGINGLQITEKILKFLYGQAYDFGQNKKNTKPFDSYMKLMLSKRPFTLVLRHSKKLQRMYHRLEYKFQDETQIQDETNVSQLIQKFGLSDCEIDARFTRTTLQDFTIDDLRDFDQKNKKPKVESSEDVTVTLDQCFENLQQKQQLQAGNQWYCPKCKQHKQAEKQLSIYKAPKILIIHLKRFKQKGLVRKEKNQSKVIFPTTLDMSKYLIDPLPMSSYRDQACKQQAYIEPKANLAQLNLLQQNKEPIYQLYAVSNHFGGLGGGHYTAYAKNNDKWFDFNDSSVRAVSQSSICGSGAYILFYKRKE